jgi:hypothetical protein
LRLEQLIAAACAQTFRLDPEHTAQVLFPDMGRGKAMQQLLRT